MSEPAPHLSLIVPVYNESARIEPALEEMAGFLRDQPYSSEIVLVDDGSSDGSAEVLRRMAPGLGVPVRLCVYPQNRGKGYALKVGFDAARGDCMLFTDCDLSTPIDELPRFLHALEDADFAIGTRRAVGAQLLRPQPAPRRILGALFTKIVQATIAPVSDATCGFKAFDRSVGKDLFGRLRIDDWSFDAELLLLARRRGYLCLELPVRWEDREGTKVRLLRDVVMSLVGIFRIRWNDLLGRYEHAVPVGARSEESFGEEVLAARVPEVGRLP